MLHAFYALRMSGNTDAYTEGERGMDRLAGVHVVSEQEAADGVFTIDQVVLPLPGARIEYPGHATAEVCAA
jgi:hypothetical protein